MRYSLHQTPGWQTLSGLVGWPYGRGQAFAYTLIDIALVTDLEATVTPRENDLRFGYVVGMMKADWSAEGDEER